MMTRGNERSLGVRIGRIAGRRKGKDVPDQFVISGRGVKIKLPRIPKIVEIRCTLESFLLYTYCQRTTDVSA